MKSQFNHLLHKLLIHTTYFTSLKLGLTPVEDIEKFTYNDCILLLNICELYISQQEFYTKVLMSCHLIWENKDTIVEFDKNIIRTILANKYSALGLTLAIATIDKKDRFN